MDIDRKHVLITGAAGNLGRAAVDKFLENGYHVVATVEEGKTLGYDVPKNVTVYPVDLQDEAKVNQFIRRVSDDVKSLDVALLLVGGFAAGGIDSTGGEELKKMIRLNFETAYYIARPLFLKMIQQEGGGRIVFVGARPALEPENGRKYLAYSLSKGLLFHLAEMLNAEARGKNVVTSVIVPGTIDTPQNRASMPSADFSKWVAPGQFAEIISFITSEKARPVAETVLKIYGNS